MARQWAKHGVLRPVRRLSAERLKRGGAFRFLFANDGESAGGAIDNMLPRDVDVARCLSSGDARAYAEALAQWVLSPGQRTGANELARPHRATQALAAIQHGTIWRYRPCMR